MLFWTQALIIEPFKALAVSLGLLNFLSKELGPGIQGPCWTRTQTPTLKSLLSPNSSPVRPAQIWLADNNPT